MRSFAARSGAALLVAGALRSLRVAIGKAARGDHARRARPAHHRRHRLGQRPRAARRQPDLAGAWWTGFEGRCYDPKLPFRMKPESLVFAAAGTLFGLLAAGFIGAQHATRAVRPRPSRRPPPSSQPRRPDCAAAAAARQAEVRPPTEASLRPSRRAPGPAHRAGQPVLRRRAVQEAAQWYEEALKLDPHNADVSTDLGVSYYYLNQPDRALAQFDNRCRSIRSTRRRCSTWASSARSASRIWQGAAQGLAAGRRRRAGESGRAGRQARPRRDEGRASRTCRRRRAGDAGPGSD